MGQPRNIKTGGFIMTWFNKQSRLVQLLLLLIPGVNWITEIVVRWSTFMKKGGLLRLIVCILVTIPSGVVFGWIDLIWVLLFKKLCLQ
jgi:hypothetical protein